MIGGRVEMNASTGRFVRKIILTVIMCALSIAMILPFLWMLSASFKDNSIVFSFPIQWIPKVPTFENFITVWVGDPPMDPPFYVYLANSLIVAVASVLGEVCTSCLAGYAFAKIKFKGRNAVFLFYIATLIFPSQMLLVPRFVIYRLWGMYDTLWALILPGMFTAFGTFLLRQFFMTLPDELMESAKIDGAGYMRTFARIALPLTKPAVSTLVIFSFVGSWNNFENPLIFLNTPANFTITRGLLLFQSDDVTNYAAIMAGCVLALIPVFILFFALQKYFVEGIVMSGIKG